MRLFVEQPRSGKYIFVLFLFLFKQPNQGPGISLLTLYNWTARPLLFMVKRFQIRAFSTARLGSRIGMPMLQVDKLTQASLVVPEMVLRLEEAESLLHSGGEAERLLHSGGGEADRLLHSGGAEAESLLHSGGEAERLLHSGGGGGEAERQLHSESSTTHKEEQFVPLTQPEDHSTTLRIELEANLPSTKDMSDRDPLETED